MEKFYVYTHHRATTGEIFYVGKGKARRAYSSISRTKHWKAIEKRDGVVVKFAAENITEGEAHKLEIELIAKYGRKDLGLGPLVNLTDGGEGAANWSENQRNAQSERMKDPEAIKKSMAALKLAQKAAQNPESKAKRAAHHIGAKRSQETRDKISQAKMGKKPINRQAVMCVETGEVFESASVVGHGVSDAARGDMDTAYGFTWVYLDKIKAEAAQKRAEKRREAAYKRIHAPKTAEHRKMLSESAKKRVGEKNSFFNRTHSNEAKAKVADANGVKVICIETGEIFSSGYEAARHLGKPEKSAANIRASIKRGGKSWGFTWAYADTMKEAA